MLVGALTARAEEKQGMALTNVLSFQVTDYAGDVKSFPVYLPADNDLADATAIADIIAEEVDDAIDGFISDITYTMHIPVVGTVKTSATTGNTVHEGALLSFSADDTVYRHSIYVPSWENAGFSGNTVLNTGDYAAAIGALDDTGDKQGNAINAFLEGKRAFRK